MRRRWVITVQWQDCDLRDDDPQQVCCRALVHVEHGAPLVVEDEALRVEFDRIIEGIRRYDRIATVGEE